MKICIIGNGLTSLTLAKTLVNQGIYVDIYYKNNEYTQNKIRTIGISKSNTDFFNQNILDIQKLCWNINKIEIYSEKFDSEKILNFENYNRSLFSIVRNDDLFDLLYKKLNKNKFFKLKKKIKKEEIIIKKYDLVFNCDSNNELSKKLFFKKIDKNYKSFAHATIIHHKKLNNNKIAIQIFTKNGPIAFLPISETETSIVYSIKNKRYLNLEEHINKFNSKYNDKCIITKIDKPIRFELKSLNLRSYHYKNVLAFGDNLHKLHPLAGQGYNMSLRDIKEILKLIKFRKKLGLPLDSSIFFDFEKKIKHKNYIFSKSIDFIYEYFNFENKLNNTFLSKSVQLLGRNKLLNESFKKIADQGLIS